VKIDADNIPNGRFGPFFLPCDVVVENGVVVSVTPCVGEADRRLIEEGHAMVTLPAPPPTIGRGSSCVK
jgi:hypothetical protein